MFFFSGNMYWSHKKEDTKSYIIESSSLDGSNRAVVMNCSDPAESLSMDYQSGRLYFVYSESGAILYVDLNTKAVSWFANNTRNFLNQTSTLCFCIAFRGACSWCQFYRKQCNCVQRSNPVRRVQRQYDSAMRQNRLQRQYDTQK